MHRAEPEINAYKLDETFRHPGTPPDEVGAAPKNLKAIPFPACGPDVAVVFDKVVGPFFEQVRLNADQTRTLSSTRDLLLAKLMSGEIRPYDGPSYRDRREN